MHSAPALPAGVAWGARVAMAHIGCRGLVQSHVRDDVAEVAEM